MASVLPVSDCGQMVTARIVLNFLSISFIQSARSLADGTGVVRYIHTVQAMGYLIDEFFSSVPLLANISASDKRYLSSHMEYAFNSFDDGEFIVEEGATSSAFFILMRGSACVTHKDQPDKILCTLNEGDIFGEMSYLTGNHRSANVVACGYVMTMRLTHEVMQEMPVGVREIIKDQLIMLMARRMKANDSANSPAGKNTAGKVV